MEVRILDYDEYVKKFEELRRSEDILPKSEGEVEERVKESVEVYEADSLVGFGLFMEGAESRDGNEHRFYFELTFEETGGGIFARFTDVV